MGVSALIKKSAIKDKIARIRAGQQPTVLDLFAGCGGLSLGCQLGGAKIIGGVELDPIAARTHALNFHASLPDDVRQAHAKARNISQTSPLALLKELALDLEPHRAVDIIVGGPPCQAFARVGRAKLREIMQHPEAFLNDPRAQLFRDYVRYVEVLSPVALIVENVPDVLNFGGLNIFEVMANSLERIGYECRYGLLNSVHYGVPQMRERCFLLAVHRLAGIIPTLPPRTHAHELPRGYQGTRDVALRSIRETLFDDSHYLEAPLGDAKLRPAVTAKDAINDMPKITDHLSGGLTKGPRRFETPAELIEREAKHYYRRLMRTWPGFNSDGYVYDHVIRYLPRDYAIFARLEPGDQYPEAYKLAQKMRDEAIRVIEEERGHSVSPDSPLYAELTARFVPPYDPGKFPNKWRKMEPDAPARTLMAHLGKDGYSHIHFDSSQARTISVREAARLQSFPDGFRFCGTMNPAFKQIGNAVPPLLGHAVFSETVGRLTGAKTGNHRQLFDRQELTIGCINELVTRRNKITHKE
jgi:DNA (cytosine-5)-methyltransferase 1